MNIENDEYNNSEQKYKILKSITLANSNVKYKSTLI